MASRPLPPSGRAACEYRGWGGGCQQIFLRGQCLCSVGRSAGLPVCRFASLPVCQSASRPVCRSAGLPVCRSARRPVGLFACSPVSRLASSPVCRSASWPVRRSASLPVRRSASLPVRQSAGQKVGKELLVPGDSGVITCDNRLAGHVVKRGNGSSANMRTDGLRPIPRADRRTDRPTGPFGLMRGKRQVRVKLSAVEGFDCGSVLRQCGAARKQEEHK